MLRVLSLFAGIGGFDLGLERTGGFKTVAFCEIDPYASRVLKKHWPDVPNLGDVTKAEFPDADFICAGFPCQDISYAGAGAGLAGERSGLWREVVRAIRMVRPQGTLLENVAALLNRGMGTVLGDLAEIGHDAEWHCIPASAVGAPHRRDRIWIYTNPRSEQHESCRAPISGETAKELSGTYHMADTNCEWELQPERVVENQRRRAGNSGKDVANASDIDGKWIVPSDTDAEERQIERERSPGSRRHGNGWWAVEPDVGRVANGIPNRAHRLRALGNAVVPQIPELIGRAILAAKEKA